MNNILVNKIIYSKLLIPDCQENLRSIFFKVFNLMLLRDNNNINDKVNNV